MSKHSRTVFGIAVCVGFLTAGCTVKSQVVDVGGVLQAETLPEHLQGCVWVEANGRKDTNWFAFKVGGKPRPLSQTMYVCCPGQEDIDPQCYQAKWFSQ